MTYRRTGGRMGKVQLGTFSIGASAALAMSAVGVATAAAPNVVTAIKNQDALIRKMPGFKIYQEGLTVKTVSAAKRVTLVIGPLERASARAVRIVALASTTDAQQRQGKAEWLKGAQEEDHGSLEYRTALEDLIAGRKSAFRAQDAKAQALIGKGLLLSVKADRRLKISIND